ncbi:MAG TPA: pyridoxal 5'-phosphate synthase glutaminase subunit PdxT [Acidobacteriaceae bacterium]|nr:pyridoxal 5'-phosphate synthase glutaminase subunit PdxT [Acidobacteriaceae bacterium]
MSPAHQPLLIGVLALQGAYDAHVRALAALGATSRLVRLPLDLHGLDGLILPGGESTTMLHFLDRNGFFEVLQTYVKSTPTFGTCAGAILLATRVEGPAQRSLGALDITVERNAYGRQNDSSILTVPTSLGDPPLEMVFIRAPRITRTGTTVVTLASRDDFPTLVRSGLILAATFHPELSADHRVHQLFLNIVRQNQVDAARKRP